ncbi:MAG: hydrogenase maturation nickel metallochaperone HypA [Tractidigestivibacter sp.]|jgi:hydrogenase nickel incorporation protein HypA/HybF|uniref:hydrogenase maturation nickel metallochaperone HypA/HybF n=1 Tax=Tractidigestivibacter sp. TaxID=2847320 RepID=UPI003D8C812F
MHELGIVVHVIDMVEKAAEENGVSKVLRLDLEVGEVSTIVPDYFRDCYKWAIKRTKYMQECELNMIIVQGISYCRDCKKTYRTTEYGRACPLCGGYNTYLVTGSDVIVRDIQAV